MGEGDTKEQGEGSRWANGRQNMSCQLFRCRKGGEMSRQDNRMEWTTLDSPEVPGMESNSVSPDYVCKFCSYCSEGCRPGIQSMDWIQGGLVYAHRGAYSASGSSDARAYSTTASAYLSIQQWSTIYITELKQKLHLQIEIRHGGVLDYSNGCSGREELQLG